ncbi:MAG: 7-cyano-7-deazaguanine synthase QueC [Candidatus Omnitrophota bacterium]|nr:7-cyano-7-deazaguanine synthase QueC [Candidatus Omnitrophota bacterium]
MKPKAVILLSGGLDSAVALYIAKKKGYDCHCLVFDYGQRHRIEIERAGFIAKRARAKLHVLKISLPWKGSSLTDKRGTIPSGRTIREIKNGGIPSTYVPSRNTIFLSMAGSLAEAIRARAIFIGAHCEDSSGYPDCRKDYLETFRKVINLGTRAGIDNTLTLKFPLIDKSKAGIIRVGKRLGVPFELTWSCYKGGKTPCHRCDSCILRAKGFREAGIKDPLLN